MWPWTNDAANAPNERWFRVSTGLSPQSRSTALVSFDPGLEREDHDVESGTCLEIGRGAGHECRTTCLICQLVA